MWFYSITVTKKPSFRKSFLNPKKTSRIHLEAVFLWLIPLLLRDCKMDLNETLGLYRVDPELMQGQRFNFRSEAQTGKQESKKIITWDYSGLFGKTPISGFQF